MGFRLLNRLFDKGNKRDSVKGQSSPEQGDGGGNWLVYNDKKMQSLKLFSRLTDNLDLFASILGQNSDVVFHPFRLGLSEGTRAALIYIEGMVDKNQLNNDILRPLMLESRAAGLEVSGQDIIKFINESALTVSGVKALDSINQILARVMYGDVLLLVDGQERVLTITMKGWEKRSISEPQSEILVQGPREGFVESISVNTTLIRRRLRSPNLVLQEIHVGRVTGTGVIICYLKGVVSPDLVAEVRQRLDRINIDGVLESGYINELIMDDPYSPFPQAVNTERPDKVAAALLEGRVAILTDNTPFALIVPAEFVSLIQSPEDFYQLYFFGSAVKVLRYGAFAASLLLPSLFIAIMTFHQEMIPTPLLISIAASREGIPFPILVEALLMEVTFEALREAGIRLPRAVGQAVSIVGALVIGQAASQAGFVSPMMVIIVAITGIASFINPAFNMAFTLRLLRFPLMLLAGSLGLYGVMLGILALIIHLSELRSFGTPYLASLAPRYPGELGKAVVRPPWWSIHKRPRETSKRNLRRQTNESGPNPPGDDIL